MLFGCSSAGSRSHFPNTMKILLINKYYYVKGGADRHVLLLQELLERNGHEVIIFSMNDPKNEPSRYAKHFVSNVDFEHVRGGKEGLRTVGRMLFSWEARRNVARLIADTKPDIAHIHNIYHQISPSILPLLRQNSIPIVQTLHDYKLICPNYSLFTEGNICERCKSHKYYNAIRHRCIKDSVSASTLAAVEMSLHKLLGLYERHVNIFISPSAFLMNTVRSWGFTNLDIRQLPYFMDATGTPNTKPGTYLLYFGRLSREKGVDTLLEAMDGITTPLKIVGTGPQEHTLRLYAKEHSITNVEFLGFKQGQELHDLVRNAMGIVVPSRWHENYPFVILEAFAAGKAVIGTRRGGIPELVKDGERGLLCGAGSPEALQNTIREFAASPSRIQDWAEHAYAFIQTHRSEQFYPKLMKIYADAQA